MLLVVGLVFGCAGFLAVELAKWSCERIVPFTDGPKPGTPPVPFLIAGAVLLGVGLAMRGTPVPLLGLSMVLCASLVACWYCDVRTGVLPDIFTLVPLGLALIVALVEHNYWIFVPLVITATPFAIIAAMTKGRGMGWGDVKLAALGGVVLGLWAALAAFAGACVVAVAIALARGRKTEPIAFGPYLAGSIGLALVFGAH